MINLEFVKRLISSLILFTIITYVVFYELLLLKFLLLILLIVSLSEWIKMIKNKLLVLVGGIFITFSFFAAFQIIQINSGFLFYIILIICISTDIGGYLFGKMIGGPKLTKISPNKTISGTIGSFLFSLIPLIIFFNLDYLDLELDLWNFTFIFLVSLISQLGDLLISFFKRKANIKDTGRILPGHGGVLDRLDGIIFAIPFSYILLILF